MKGKYFYGPALLLALFGYINVKACDVCGAAVNANYLGILPQYRQHFVGVRYMNIGTTSRALPTLFEESSGYSQSLLRADLWGRFYLTNRLQLYAFVPFQYSEKTEGGSHIHNYGLSDISLTTNYILFNTGDSGRLNWRNTLLGGVGLKLPTGAYDPLQSAAMQNGTGSWDMMVNVIYTTRYQKMGMNIDANLRINTTAQAYHFGNRLSSSIRWFYWQQYKLISFLPHIGLLTEWAQKDTKYEIAQKFTGGYGVYPVMGVDVYFRKITAGLTYAVPAKERLNEGYATTNQRISLQLLYLF